MTKQEIQQILAPNKTQQFRSLRKTIDQVKNELIAKGVYKHKGASSNTMQDRRALKVKSYKFWLKESEKYGIFNWSDEELKKAQESLTKLGMGQSPGFIGEKHNVKCFIRNRVSVDR